jgi:hypothetical protein
MKTGWNKGKKYRKYKRLTEEPKMNLKCSKKRQSLGK